jgi:hypothetical protein
VSHGVRPALLWLALAVAFSPTLAELARELPERPDAPRVLAGALLFGLAAARDAGPFRARRGAAAGVLLFAIALQAVGIAADSWSIARIGLGLAVVGLSLWLGRPRFGVSLLALFAVPIPSTLTGMLSPGLESAAARLAAGIAGGLGLELRASGPLLHAAAGSLELRPSEAGLSLVMLAANLGWYAAQRQGGGLGASAVRTLTAVLLAIPVQILCLALGAALLGLGGVEAARLWLAYGALGALLAGGLALAHRKVDGLVAASPRRLRPDPGADGRIQP